MNCVKDFGAKGDGLTKDTAAIQKAIDSGGVVHFPPGIYLSGTLYLKSQGGLDLEAGATLLASPDREDYNSDNFCAQNRVFAQEHVSGGHFIVAVEQENLSITGAGRIDGNRKAFYGSQEDADCERHNGKFSFSDLPADFWRPAQMIFFCECANVLIRDVQLFNAPYWTCFLHGCDDVIVSGLRILNDQRTPNGDGIDIDCCRRVTISDCLIDTGDDCITLRGNDSPLKNKRACEYISISNCVLHTNCNAFRIGVGNGLVRHAVISNIVFHHTRTAICIVSQYSTSSPGVQIEDISFNNLQMDCDRAFLIATTPRGPRPEEAKQIKDLSINQVRARVRASSIIQGSRLGYVSGITFSDMILTMVSGREEWIVALNENVSYGEFASKSIPGALLVQNIQDISFDRVRVRWEAASPLWQHGVMVLNSDKPGFTNCDFGKVNYSDCACSPSPRSTAM